MIAVLALVLSLMTPSLAADDAALDAATRRAVHGEMDRLSGEIKALGRRQIWVGVERKYSQLLKLEVPAPAQVHLVAAYSARERGDLLEVHSRLMRAASVEPSEVVIDWLYDLDHNYGRVELNAERKRSVVLVVREMPLDPNRRKAVEAAVKSCANQGQFNGLLPRGAYQFYGQDFNVEPGIAVLVEVSPRVRRQGVNKPTIIYRELPQATAKESE